MDFSNVSIIGAGTMGRGIAQLLVQNSFNVHLFDTDKNALTFSFNEIKKDSWKLINPLVRCCLSPTTWKKPPKTI